MPEQSIWHLLVSHVVSAARYDERTQTLRVRFTNGRTYKYFDVPSHVFDEFLEPEDGSHGRYFNDEIRDAYDYQDLTP